MVITEVEAFAVPYVESNDNGSVRHACLVKVSTDEGAFGWGEAVTIFAEAAAATASLVAGLRDVVVGKDPRATAAAWAAIEDRAWWYGNGGIASFAQSAIDIALWDIRGKLAGSPLVDVLGGPVRDSLPTIISCHASRADLTEMAEEMADWVADAEASGIKVGFGKSGDANLGLDHERDVAFVRRLREVLGPNSLIMIDIGPRVTWSVADAVRRVRAFEEDGVYWVEEPLGADNPHGYETLRAKTTTLLAYGEREWTVRGIERIVASGTVDVVGIDPGRAQGITGFIRACTSITAAQRQANAHAFAGPITFAAAAALSLACSPCHQLEVPPFMNELYTRIAMPPRPDRGRLRPFTEPGLGIDIDEAAVRQLAREQARR